VAEHYGQITAGTHNDHLRVLLELGFVGLSLWLGLFASAARSFRKALRTSKYSSLSHLKALIGLAALIAYFVGGIFENLLTTTVYQWYWWSLLLPGLIPVRISNSVFTRKRVGKNHPMGSQEWDDANGQQNWNEA
jgi:O-antigen ligase